MGLRGPLFGVTMPIETIGICIGAVYDRLFHAKHNGTRLLRRSASTGNCSLADEVEELLLKEVLTG